MQKKLESTPADAATAEAEPSSAPAEADLPLAGLRVVEFSHMVMGPACGLVLGDLGAEVIKVEPPAGDSSRRLLGSGAGFFAMFNRNKKSVALDLTREEGLAAARQLVMSADVLVENFRPGAMRRLGLDWDSLAPVHPRLIHVSHKGFLPGPYEHRTALDEVVQMMGGLAYMTGRPGDPLRAGASVNDIMGGMFGAIGVLAALVQRGITGRGQSVTSALFENNVFLVAQHMLQFAVTGRPADPMPARLSAWAVYDVFTVAGGAQVFLAVVSDAQWAAFCEAFDLPDLAADPRLRTNNDRVQARDWLLPRLREQLATLPQTEVLARFERAGLPFAPIARPHDLFDDPHLNATGGLAPMTLPDGRPARTPLLPLLLGGRRLPLRRSPPPVGADTRAVLTAVGYAPATVDDWIARGIAVQARGPAAAGRA